MYEIYRKKKMSKEDAKQMCDILEKNKEAWIDIMMVEELGLIPDDENPAKNALVTFISFCLFGAVPITPFIYS
jgi:vacuolar iron transporter family protein